MRRRRCCCGAWAGSADTSLDRRRFRSYINCAHHLRSTKRDRTLEQRGLDFADAAEVFAGTTFEFSDGGIDYGEPRVILVGRLRGPMVIIVFTDRPSGRHIISMRKANDREQQRYRVRLD